MMMFHSYVSLPEGTRIRYYINGFYPCVVWNLLMKNRDISRPDSTIFKAKHELNPETCGFNHRHT